MRKRLKNIILKGIVATMLVVFMVSGCLLDSEVWVPAFIVCIASFAFLAMFAYANGMMGGERR